MEFVCVVVKNLIVVCKKNEEEILCDMGFLAEKF